MKAIDNTNRDDLIKTIKYIEELRQPSSTRSNWQNSKIKDIESLAHECGLDADYLDEISALQAKEFITALPFDIEFPDIGVEDSGMVLLEWFVKKDGEQTIFSLVLGMENYIFSLTTSGQSLCHGSLNYSTISMDFLFTQIRKHFEINSNHARSEIG